MRDRVARGWRPARTAGATRSASAGPARRRRSPRGGGARGPGRGPRTRPWRGTRSPTRRRTRWIRARSSGVVVRLGDVVLGELVEEVGLVVAGVDRRQDDDRQVGPGLDLAGQGQAVHPRHQQVDDQEVRPGRLEPAQRLLPSRAVVTSKPSCPELLGERRRAGRGRRRRAGSGAPVRRTAGTASQHGPSIARRISPRNGPNVPPGRGWVRAPWGRR